MPVGSSQINFGVTVATLQLWANHFPNRQPEHFVFPRERYGGDGELGCFGFRCLQFGKDKTPHLEQAEFEPLKCRLHDLRHTAVSRMLDAGVPLAKIAKIVGWSTSTMVQMSARYGHFTLDETRGAVESISRSHDGHSLDTTDEVRTQKSA